MRGSSVRNVSALTSILCCMFYELGCGVAAASGQRRLSMSRGPGQDLSRQRRQLNQQDDLAQISGPGSLEHVLAVTSPVELQEAIENGVAHIEIQSHMALSTLPLRPLRQSALTAVLGGVPGTVLSIQGNCTQPPPEALLARAGLLPDSPDAAIAAKMRPLKPGQCLLLSDANVLYARNGRLWLSNVYIRMRTTERTRTAALHPSLISVTDAPSGRLYMTNVTLQGSSNFPSTGLYITSAAYIADSEFLNLGMSAASVRVLVKDATASFERCTFTNNSVPSPAAGVITTSLNAVAVRLQGCRFDSGPAAPRSLVDANGSAMFFSDKTQNVWRTAGVSRSEAEAGDAADVTPSQTEPLDAVPRTVLFLDDTDLWLQDVQLAVIGMPRVHPVDPANEGGLSVGVVAAIITVLLVPLLCLVLGILLWVRRRKRMAADAASAEYKRVNANGFSFHGSAISSAHAASAKHTTPRSSGHP
eukprot:jgi/Ulvmu1/3728/UM173_0001.1